MAAVIPAEAEGIPVVLTGVAAIMAVMEAAITEARTLAYGTADRGGAGAHGIIPIIILIITPTIHIILIPTNLRSAFRLSPRSI